MHNEMMRETLKEAVRINLRQQLREAYIKINSAKIASRMAMEEFGLSAEEATQFVNGIDEEVFIEQSGYAASVEDSVRKGLI